MTDINDPLSEPFDAKRADGAASNKLERRSDAELLAYAELLFFAYRDFTRDPDAILKGFGFGRAHHRVLHFVTRHSGLRVADLLDALKITKQSLGRVLKQLVDKGYIVQRAGSIDRRERLLYPTASGRALAKRLAAPQLVRLAEALKAAGPGADVIVRRFLQAMINAEERPKVSSIMSPSPAPDGDGKAEVS
ncbi:MAG TPA: MarR family transcriptional regulator [Methyloceanibacter sp.]|nr:MarR family transcriptional regulator [Methyloceanibacter sp.]